MWPNRRRMDYTHELQEESDDEAFHGANAPVDLLLLGSLETTYAAVQRTSTMRPMPCDCTEVLSVQSTDMASTSYMGPTSPPYPHMLYYPRPLRRTSTPDPEIDIPNGQRNDDHTDQEMPLSTFAREQLSDVELTPIMVQRAKRHAKTVRIARSKDLPFPEPSLARRRRFPAHKMSAAKLMDSHVANKIVKYARCIRNMHDRDMGCLNCGLLPVCPITGSCGHTRCSHCVADKVSCPCGDDSSRELYVNILIRDLVEKTTSDRHPPRSSRIMPVPTNVSAEDSPDGVDADMATGTPVHPLSGASGSCRGTCRLKRRARTGTPYFGGHKRIPMTPRARYNHALDLLRLGQHREAVPYLALAAASGQPDLRQARILLARAITVLSNNRDPRSLTTQLNRSVRRLSSTSWIKLRDMECILCCDIFTNPVTTPCGHMFCRTCLERTLDYGKKCPLCLRDLFGFILSETSNTLFVQAALKSINAVVAPLPLEPDLIPIFVCTVAFPSIPCPLFIFDPRYWLMIRRVLESGSRRFGMVACDRRQDYVDYGTVLEVRDCVHLEDGRSILSTIGLSRFRVIERGVRDGCEVARILPISDVIPRDFYEVEDLKSLARRIMLKAILWLSRLNAKVLADIEASFGAMQSQKFFDDAWWESPDGPSWLWWLVAILPLRSEIKVLILSTDCLAKRMLAVARTIDAVNRDSLSTVTSRFEISPLPSDTHTLEEDGT